MCFSLMVLVHELIVLPSFPLAAIVKIHCYQNISPRLANVTQQKNLHQQSKQFSFRSASWTSAFYKVTSSVRCIVEITALHSSAGTEVLIPVPACHINSALTSHPGAVVGDSPWLQRLMMTECSSCEALTGSPEWVHKGWNSCMIAQYPQDRQGKIISEQPKRMVMSGYWLMKGHAALPHLAESLLWQCQKPVQITNLPETY